MNPENNKQSSRRRFLLKSAVISAPVIMSAISRPVLGAKCSLSGMQSGNLSRDQDIECVLGLSPGAWKENRARDGDWPYPLSGGQCTGSGKDEICSGFPLFHDPAHGFTGNQYGNLTMLEVMRDYNDNNDGPGNHLVAALLNAYEWLGTYVLTVENVHQLYDQYLNGEITSGDLRAFLDTTWT